MPDIADPDDKSLGRKIRDLVNTALKDDRRQKIQLELLDKAFEQIAIVFPKLLEKEYNQIAHHVKTHARDDQDKSNLIVITAVTTTKDDDTDSPYSPIRRIRIPISTDFTEFTAEEVRNLPGYKKMHEAFRDLDIAVKVSGLVDGDEGRGGIPMVTVNTTKTYDQGADFLYPALPPKPAKFDAKKPKGFDLR